MILRGKKALEFLTQNKYKIDFICIKDLRKLKIYKNGQLTLIKYEKTYLFKNKTLKFNCHNDNFTWLCNNRVDYLVKLKSLEKEKTRKNIYLWYEALAKLKGLEKIDITLQGLKIFFKYYNNKLTILNKDLNEQITWDRYNKIAFNTLENGRDLFFYDLTTSNIKDVFSIDTENDYLFLGGILQGQLKKFRL